jgi:glutathione S-transferase
MILIGVNRSPYTRRVAITLNVYGIKYEQKHLSGFGNRADVRAANPLGRIPALVLDTGETLIDSHAIVDHLDETYGRERALTPPAGANRRAVMRIAALMMGACDKGLQAAYHRNHTPKDKQHQPWIDDCLAQVEGALLSVEAMIAPGQKHVLLGWLTQADICAVVAERLARGVGVDTDKRTPNLRALASALSSRPEFQVVDP